MVILWTLLAVVALLLLMFSRPFTNAMFVVIAFSHWVSLLLSKSIFRRNLTMPWPFFKFSCFLVVLFVSNSFALNVVWGITLFNLHFVWMIIRLIILNNFQLFPPKSICVPRLTEITSYEIFFFCSRHAGINGNR